MVLARRLAPLLFAVLLIFGSADGHAHGVDDVDRAFLEQTTGTQVASFIWLGAKHMVTGYDHLLFLFGVIFFLRGLRDVAIYVSLFAIGHSITLTGGVLTGSNVNPFLIDAIIGLSVVYKGLDNLGALKQVLRFQPDARAAVLVFGLCHGLGLATKLQEFSLSVEGIVPNILSFNVGVELGQFAALGVILVGMRLWRATKGFERHAAAANIALTIVGGALTAYQLHGYFRAPASSGHTPAMTVASGQPPATDAAVASAQPPPPAGSPPAPLIEVGSDYIFRNEAVDLTLSPGQGSEVKAVMRGGDQFIYSWKADGELFFEFHGEQKGAPSSEYSSYAKGTATSAEGEFEAPFEGTHGWYWKNRRNGPVTVRVEARGVFATISKL